MLDQPVDHGDDIFGAYILTLAAERSAFFYYYLRVFLGALTTRESSLSPFPFITEAYPSHILNK